jgi:hypothetical protein
MTQISTLITSAQVQATKDDVARIGVQVKNGSDQIVAAIKGKPLPPAVNPPKQSDQQVPTVEHTTLVQRPTVSDTPEFPYALQVIVQSNITLDPVALGFKCDGR